MTEDLIEVEVDSVIQIDIEITKIPGLYYIENIQNIESIQNNILNVTDKLDCLEWISLSKNSRLVQQYGYKYNYYTRKIGEKCEDIPLFLRDFKNLLQNICLELKIIDKNYDFNQCIVNNYNIGEGINSHIDLKLFGGVIGCFSIGSGTIIKFTNENNEEEIYIKPNSLYIMSGDSRYKWSHGMPLRKLDIVGTSKLKRKRRISITFRNVPVH